MDSVRKKFFEFAKQCEKDGFANLSESLSSKLSYQKLVKQHVIGRDEDRCPIYDGFELDLFGQLYYEYLKEKKRQEFIYGIRWWITTAIAVLALLTAVGSFLWQMQTYTTENSQSKNPDIYSEQHDNIIDINDSTTNGQSGG